MRVRDLSGAGRPPAVAVEVGAAYEMLLSLYAFTTPEEKEVYEVGPSWFEAIEAAASADLLAAVAAASGGQGHTWIHLLGLASESVPPHDVASFVALLEATPALEIRLQLLGYHLQTPEHDVPRERILRAAQGDPRAQEEYLRGLHDEDEHHGIRALLAQGLEESKAGLLAVLRRWYEEVFQAQEEQLMAVILRDAASKRRLLKSRMAPERLIEVATNGVRFLPQPGIRRVLLIPSMLLRPWVIVSEHRDAKIIYYSVADESLVPDAAPSPERLSAFYKALADERRLEILKVLATRSLTLQELADDLGIGKSLAHHHLVALRVAGLVRVTSQPDKRYSLREDAIATVGERLATYLDGDAPPAPARAPRAPRARRKE